MTNDHLDVLLEDIRGKFDLVLEGHAALDRKIDDRFDRLTERLDHHSFLFETLNQKIDAVDVRLGAKIDAVAANLSAHRADTEAHGPAWRVREGGE